MSATKVKLEPNAEAAAEFNDKTTDHRWITVPAHDDPLQWDLRIAKAARDLAKSSNLNDCHGTMPFADFMDQLETELKGNLAENYTSGLNWHERWRQIIRGSQVMSFKLVWLHAQYVQCEQHTPFSEDWWAAVPTPTRIKFIGSSGAPIVSEARGFP